MSNDIVLPLHDFRPRDYQLNLWRYMLNGGDRAAAVWHRRAGKDLVSLNITIMKMMERVGLYWHILPSYTQGRKIAWEGMDGAGHPFISYFPEQLIDRKRDDLMQIRLKNGSVWQVVGGDNPDRLVGSNPVGVVMSEYSLHNPECWDLIRPILLENKGWMVAIYTARGHNHGFDMLKAAKEHPERWYQELLTIEDTKRPDGTPVVTREDVEEERRAGMPEELIRQEFWNDFNAPLVGSYYGKELDLADKEGRIGSIPWRKERPVFTSWDLGMSDSMVIWFGQLIGEWIHWIDFYAASGAGLEHYAKVLQDKPYIYKNHYAPHDIKVRELGTGRSRFEVAHDLGIRFRIAPNLHVEDGINASRTLISRSQFDAKKCEDGLKALRHYRREFSAKNRVWSARPVHDWSSHPADAFRMAAVCLPRSATALPKTPVAYTPPTFQECMDNIIRRAKRQPQKRWI